MTATIIDGKRVAEELLDDCARKVAAMGAARPGLAVVIVGENPASQVYVRNKVRACEKVGFYSEKYELPADTPSEEVLAKIESLNRSPKIHGILVQLPLPPHIDEESMLAAIDPQKDVDGFHAVNLGRLTAGLPALWPCTPSGCMELLRRTGAVFAGRHAVVVGRSNIVGKPMGLMLINAGATVTVCNSKTPDLAATVRQGDIVVAAVGRPKLISADMIKPGAAVIDVGINRPPQGGLVGDVDFDSVVEVAGAVTPVPGGVGPMTIAMLMVNTLRAGTR